MNKKLTALVSAAFIYAGAALGQGTFQNLDYEAAKNLRNGSLLATSNALPGWAAFSGANQLSTIGYNVFGAVPPVQLFGSNSMVLNGDFSVGLLSGSGSISQTGLVTADTQWLFFKGSWSSLSPLLVSLNEQNLAYTALSTEPNYTLYGADISNFAGQTATLRFLAPSGSAIYYMIDDIQIVVPEPSSFALFGLGGFLLAAQAFRGRRSRP